MRKLFVRATPLRCQMLPVASMLSGRVVRTSLPLPRTLKVLPPPARFRVDAAPWTHRAALLPPSVSLTVQPIRVRVPPLTSTVWSAVLVCNVAPVTVMLSPVLTVIAGDAPSTTVVPPPSMVILLLTVRDSLNVPPCTDTSPPVAARSMPFWIRAPL